VSRAAAHRRAWLALACAAIAVAGCTRVRLPIGSERDGGIPAVDVPIGPLYVEPIALGADHGCAVLVDGRVACWGADDHGQLALQREIMFGERCGDRDCATRPTPSELLAGVVEVVAGDGFSCARTAGGEASCWGSHRVGELGAGIPSDYELHSTPRPVAAGVAQLAAGRHHACLRDTDGIVSCWGLGAHGQLGATAPESCLVRPGLERDLGVPDGTASVPCAVEPVVVAGLGPVDRVVAGDDHTCALQSGRVLCWGRDHRAQLGDGAAGEDRATPVDVGVTGAVDLALGGDASLALRPEDALAWGDGSRAQLAAPAVDACPGEPCAVAPVGSRAPPTTVLGRDHGCGIDAAGRALCWGLAAEGRLGTAAAAPDTCAAGPCALDPRPVDLPPGVRAIAVGDGYACALVFGTETSASVRCWGRNEIGQTGSGRFGAPEPLPAEALGTR
jgi:alpha-tubulin suppressor-like RCC1 family protein